MSPVLPATSTNGHSRLPWLSPSARSWRSWGPLAAGAGMMALGIAMRASTFGYSGAATQRAFNSFASDHLGAYSDIASLFFRNRMWHQALPYFHYPFEYPVGTGLVAWLTSLAGGGIAGYFAVNAALLAACGLLTLWLLHRLPGANPWLLALAPTLGLYVVLNWDLVSIAALMIAFVLFHRRRDGWAAVALGVATWTKFFPVIALPIVLLARLLDARGASVRERIHISARIVAPFALVTAVINAPFLIAHPGRWLYFFRFNDMRRGGGSLWALIDNGHIPVSTANVGSVALLLAGLAVAFAAIAWAHRRHGVSMDDLIAPAMLVSFGWLFFTIKLYSPQYDLWVMVLVACAGAPVALAVAFATVDLAFFTAAFTQFRINNRWVEIHVIRPTIAVREAVLLAIIAWALWQIVGPRLRRAQSLPVAEPERVSVLAGGVHE